MKLTWFGHSAFRVEVNDQVILIDPYLKENPSFDGDFAEAVKGATHVIATHGHFDHLGDAKEICEHTGAVFISTYEVCNFAPLPTTGTISVPPVASSSCRTMVTCACIMPAIPACSPT